MRIMEEFLLFLRRMSGEEKESKEREREGRAELRKRKLCHPR
jgi:hypothetical protein